MIRFGVLGAAAIVPAALVKPAAAVDGVDVLAVAARDPVRARTFAAKHRIPRVHDTYDDVLADPEIDAVYVPLPNSLHAQWTLAAIDAGKHVLCEKPFAANAAEAARVAEAAERSGLVVMEAFHWRYHPLAARALDVIANGGIGEVRDVRATMCFPLFKRGDIRWQWELAGGAMMDAGCYPVSIVRTLAGSEPEVVRAHAKVRTGYVDRVTVADLAFPNGVTGRIKASMWSTDMLRLSARVQGDKGSMHILNPVGPQYFNRLTVKTPAGRRSEKVPGEPTYVHQLRAFAAAVERGEPTFTPPSSAVANMAVIDAIYRAAGLPLRVGATDL